MHSWGLQFHNSILAPGRFSQRNASLFSSFQYIYDVKHVRTKGQAKQSSLIPLHQSERCKDWAASMAEFYGFGPEVSWDISLGQLSLLSLTLKYFH